MVSALTAGVDIFGRTDGRQLTSTDLVTSSELQSQLQCQVLRLHQNLKMAMTITTNLELKPHTDDVDDHQQHHNNDEGHHHRHHHQEPQVSSDEGQLSF